MRWGLVAPSERNRRDGSVRNGGEKVSDGYREEKGEVHATLQRLQAAGLQVNAGLSTLGDGELQQEGEDGQQVCVCVIE